MIEKIRALADQMTERYYEAARQEHLNSQFVATSSFLRGRRLTLSRYASKLYDLIGDAEPDWDAMYELAGGAEQGDGSQT